jgi:uncharacterized protein YbcC (UPF0753/DUF2309 family)
MLKSKQNPDHLRITSPAWPLQSMVAVNPFWNQIDTPFEQVMQETGALIHAPLFMPISYYLEKYNTNSITDEDIARALKSTLTTSEFIHQSKQCKSSVEIIPCFSDFLDREQGTHWGSLFSFELSKYAAAYFDSGQALAQFPYKNLSFLDAWIQSQPYEKTLERSGLKNFRNKISIFNGLNSKQVIEKITRDLGITVEKTRLYYLARLSATVIGWASQFRYHEWQAQLGYESNNYAHTEDLVAVRMILDFALIQNSEIKHPRISSQWLLSLSSACEATNAETPVSKLQSVWQTALEIHEQTALAAKINSQINAHADPLVQIAMCIDVRSELFRRSIEAQSERIKTIGFAGFFGIPFDFQRIDENTAAHRLPALLSPAFKVKEEVKSGSENKIMTNAMVQSYFRNLRKAPLSSFLYVELFWIISLKNLLVRLWTSIITPRSYSNIRKRFSDDQTKPSQTCVSFESKADRAFGALTHMGLKDRFSRLVVIAGHGSVTTNNAFNSSLDCGACGGNAGDMNARFLCESINDPKMRLELSKRGMNIPQTTHFLAAIHETVNDELFFLDEETVPNSHQNDLMQLKQMTDKASMCARTERQTIQSIFLDPSSYKRSKNWSEVRPEWALAGNSAFIVAPRSFTQSEDFSNRVFLHDYNHKTDENFKTLELIMTAPMIVTNWINMQYYASTVAPTVFGSGNKILHNLVNECGVLEGNGGDLKIGLPWQSVHDGERFVHEPMRLSVYIAAPIDKIEKIIQTHETVRKLVDNQWLTLHQIDESTHTIRKRTSHDQWD